MNKIKLYIFFGLIVFVGSLIMAGCSGERTIKYNDGSIYVGEGKDGLKHGQGRIPT